MAVPVAIPGQVPPLDHGAAWSAEVRLAVQSVQLTELTRRVEALEGALTWTNRMLLGALGLGVVQLILNLGARGAI